MAEAKASMFSLVVTLVTAGLGTGILSLPWGVAGASIATSLIILAFVLLINGFTCMILVYAAERYQAFDLGAVLGHFPGRLGKAMQYFTNFLVWVTMFLCLVGYMIVIADSVQPLGARAGGIWVHRYTYSVLGSALVFPICFLPMRWLSFTSVLTVLVNIYLFAVLVSELVTFGPVPDYCWLGFSTGTITFATAVFYSIILQMCILPIYAELEDRTPRRFMWVMILASVGLFVMFTLVAVTGYITYGADVESNVMRNFADNFAGNLARCLMVVVVTGVYPIMLTPMVAPLRVRTEKEAGDQAVAGVDHMVATAEYAPLHGNDDEHDERVNRGNESVRPRCQNWVAHAATTGIVLAAMVSSFFISDLGILNVINGALSVSGFVALAPALVGLYLLGDLSEQAWWRVLMWVLLVLGMVMTGCGFVFTQNRADTLLRVCVIASGVQ